MKRKITAFLLGIGIAGLLLGGCGKKEEVFKEASMKDIKKGTVSAGAAVHDPSIVVGEDGKYYIFGSHMSAAKSDDLVHWTSFADGVDRKNPLLGGLFDEKLEAFSFVGKNTENWYSVWAPDVIYNKQMGKYVMYFCTTSSYIMSDLCFATSDHLEGPYEYQDTILYSGYLKTNASKTNVLDFVERKELEKYTKTGLGYNNQLWPNCIDPTVFYDADGKLWMTYGSWSGGIFLLELDEKTGYPIHPEGDEKNQVDPYYGKRLLGGYHQSIEGPYIMYDPVSEYYYLFVSYGSLTSEGGYQIRLFRSKEVDGTYEDAAGRSATLVDSENTEYNKDYGLKMMGNYLFPSLKTAYMAPGHNSAFLDQDGKMYVVYHQRFDDGEEFHEPRVHQLFRTKDGWLVAAPFAVSGETLKEDGYQAEEVAGTYYVLNHGTDISAKIQEAEPVKFYSDGTVKKGEGEAAEEVGSYKLEEGTPYVDIVLDKKEFTGVMLAMTDEAGNAVMCFSAMGTNNETIWGVHYK